MNDHKLKLLIILIYLITSCSNKKTILVSNFEKEQILHFSSNSKKDVSVIVYSLKGEIDGKIMVSGLNNDNHLVTGKIDTTFHVDYFTNSASLLLYPMEKATGNLQIQLGFY